jgi:hypothetical protein
MEPLLVGGGSRHRAALTDLAFELTQKSAGFRRSLPPSLLVSRANLVRAMNCYGASVNCCRRISSVRRPGDQGTPSCRTGANCENEIFK